MEGDLNRNYMKLKTWNMFSSQLKNTNEKKRYRLLFCLWPTWKTFILSIKQLHLSQFFFPPDSRMFRLCWWLVFSGTSLVFLLLAVVLSGKKSPEASVVPCIFDVETSLMFGRWSCLWLIWCRREVLLDLLLSGVVEHGGSCLSVLGLLATVWARLNPWVKFPWWRCWYLTIWYNFN